MIFMVSIEIIAVLGGKKDRKRRDERQFMF